MSEIQEPGQIIQKLTDQNLRKTQFISTVSHEFRTYITALSMNIQMLEMYESKWPPEKKLTVFRRLQNSMKSMIHLLDEVSFLAKDFDDRLTLSFSDFDLLSFCKEAVDKVNTSELFTATAVLTTGDVPVSVQTDSSLFNHIVTNVLNNAMKFSPSGGQVDLFLGLEDANTMLVAISDKGIGIPSDELEHIGEAFYRAKNALQFAGSGLGLTVVHRSVELLKGKIDIRSVIEQGTQVTVRLPLTFNA